jgi:hypothetical protein
LNCSKLLDTDGRPNGFATLSGRMLLTEDCPDFREVVRTESWNPTSLSQDLHRIFLKLLK